MRLASWIFIVCAVVTALSVFMPVLEVGGTAIVSKRQTLSLHGAAENRKLVRKLLAASRHSHALRLGSVALGKAMPHAGGRTKDVLEDAGDAYDTLSGISDDDAKQAGRGLLALTWILIGLCAAMLALVFFDVVGGVFHRGRIIGALVLSLIVAALGVAVRIGLGMVVFEANDELGATAVSLGTGALVMQLAAVSAFLVGVALLVLEIRSRRAA
ncbi:MAG: hypothetical protein ABI678_24325 [Kofleriaceae bacterium]